LNLETHLSQPRACEQWFEFGIAAHEASIEFFGGCGIALAQDMFAE
jgi:hypothetical protein